MSLVIEFKIDPVGLKLLQEKIGKLAAKSQLQMATREAGLYIQRKVIQKTPVDTGAARGSVHLKTATSNGAVVAGTLTYLPGLELGTKAHIIMPKHVKFLKFKSGSGVIFARKVKHPGTKGYHMFRDGLLESKSAVEQILAKHVGKI